MEPNIKFHPDDKNKYPFVNNVDTFLTETKFDFSLWKPNSKITLTHVPWTSDYKDVVKFDTDEDRDNWFSQQISSSQFIDKAVRVPRNGEVSLPVTYNNLINYNYIIAEYPLPPGQLPNERTRNKYFYFVKDVEYVNATVSKVYIQLDVWTTFINSIEIGNTMLERGHATMAYTSVDEYLKCPLENNRGLLSTDIYFDDNNTVKYEKFIPFRKGQQYVLIATSGSTGTSWDDNTTCIGPNIEGNVPSNTRVFAIKTSDYINFMNTINTNIPQFIQTIKAIFYLDESFITLNGDYQFQGFTLYNVLERKSNLGDIILSKDMFDFEEKYSWITKLYTSPYSVIEIHDNIGKMVTVNIEDIFQLSIRSMSSLAFPFINLRAFISGISGGGSNEYTVKTFNGESQINLSKDNWQEYLFDIDIPTYGIYQKNEDNYMFNSKFSRQQDENNILTSYESNLRSINTSETNSNRSNTSQTEVSLATNSHNTNIANISLDNDVLNIADEQNYSEEIFGLNSMQQEFIHIAAENTQSINFQNTQDTAVTTGSLALAGTVIGGMLAGPAGAAAGAGAGAGAAGIGITGAALLSTGIQGINLITSSSNRSAAFHSVLSTNEGLLAETLNNNRKIQNASNVFNAKILNRNGNTNRENVSRTNSLNQSNINRSKNTNSSNISSQANNSRLNNDENASNSRNAISNIIKQQKLNNNIEFGGFGGNSSFLDTENMRGLDIKVKTQKKDIIENTASIFLRYGYMYDGDYEFETFNIMKHFTYWKFSEIWIRSNYVYEGIIQDIRDILLTGMTVWNEPDEIGFVKIINNTVKEV